MTTLEESLNRQKVIRAAILLAAGQNTNMPSHARRLLLQRYGVQIYDCEIEAECVQLAADALRELSRLAQKSA